ncbi:MAG TPA: M56 family metallopeptidase [Vicinamibacterales bacterium]|nr:M56 family metallopeptidase [Vicinamibacterales bacterium]
MNLLFESALKVSVVVSIGLLAGTLLRQRSAAFRHWVLAAAMLAALATPLLMALAPSWSLPVQSAVADRGRATRPAAEASRRAASIAVTTTVTSTKTTPPAQSIDPVSILLAVWLAGVIVNLSGLLNGLWRLHRIAARAVVVHDGPWADAAHSLGEHYGLRRAVCLLQSDQAALLLTWGFFAPKVMLPTDAASWANDRIRVVLAHELAHIRRSDWIIQIAGELLRIVYWFNPLMWFASARLRLESERACDDAVVNLGVHGRDYAVHLLELARQFGRASQASFPASAITPRPSSLQRRVSAMLNPRLSRRPLSGLTRLGTIAGLLVVTLPIALFAQNTFATMAGTIVDASGGVLPGVSVVLADTDRRVRHQVSSDGTGRFELIGLPQGAYTLEASLPGFETFRQKLTLSGQDVNRDITLPVGTLQETIGVINGGPGDGPGAPPPDYRAGRRPPNCGPGTGRSSDPVRPSDGALRIGGVIRTPRKLFHVSPIYPQGSPAGTVRMNAVIGVDGRVKETTVTDDAPPALAQSAIDAVQRWEFDPTLLNCVPVEVRMTVVVDYR